MQFSLYILLIFLYFLAAAFLKVKRLKSKKAFLKGKKVKK